MVIESSIVNKKHTLLRGEIDSHLNIISLMGCRWPSYPAESFAASYIEEVMGRYADEVISEPFEYPRYIPLEARLEVITSGGKEYNVLGVQYSANGECEGRLINVGAGEEADFKTLGAKLENKILLARTRRPYVVYTNSKGTGAKAIVLISESPKNTIRAMSAKAGYVQGENPEKYRTSIPIIAIDAFSGNYLEKLCEENEVKVHLVHKSLQIMGRSRNVVGKIFGKTEKSVIIGAHYDTQINVPGAWDNAAGCALLLGGLRSARSLKAKHNMEFVAFGCEEVGIVGSTRFVELRKNKLNNIVCFFNLDSVSSIASTTFDVHTTPRMKDFASEVLESICGLKPTSYNLFGPHNVAQDSAPFFKNGVNAIWVHEEGNPYFHTPQDTLEKIDIERLVRVGDAIFKMYAYIAMGASV